MAIFDKKNSHADFHQLKMLEKSKGLEKLKDCCC